MIFIYEMYTHELCPDSSDITKWIKSWKSALSSGVWLNYFASLLPTFMAVSNRLKVLCKCKIELLVYSEEDDIVTPPQEDNSDVSTDSANESEEINDQHKTPPGGGGGNANRNMDDWKWVNVIMK